MGGWKTGGKGQRTAEGLTTDRQILSILKQSVWPSSVVPSQRTDDGLTTDRQILSILKQSVWPSSVVPSQRTDDGLAYFF